MLKDFASIKIIDTLMKFSEKRIVFDYITRTSFIFATDPNFAESDFL